MTQVRVERLDHLGLIASVIKHLELIDIIDARLVPDEQEVAATPRGAAPGQPQDAQGGRGGRRRARAAPLGGMRGDHRRRIRRGRNTTCK
jgi:hypothetical protein